MTFFGHLAHTSTLENPRKGRGDEGRYYRGAQEKTNVSGIVVMGKGDRDGGCSALRKKTKKKSTCKFVT